MKLFFIVPFIFLLGCSILSNDEKIKPDILEKIDSTWANPLKEDTFVPIIDESLEFEAVLQNTDQKLIINVQGLVSIKNKVSNYKTKIYTSTFYFNSEALKKFKDFYKKEIKKIYGPDANIYIGIRSKNPKPNDFSFSFSELNQYSSFASIINIDAMDNAHIELKDICSYGNYTPCKEVNSIYPFPLIKGEKIKLVFAIGILTNEIKSEGYFAKIIELNYDPTL